MILRSMSKNLPTLDRDGDLRCFPDLTSTAAMSLPISRMKSTSILSSPTVFL